MDVLYNDVDASRKSELEAGMIPHALAALETQSGAPAWAESAFDGRRAYLRTADDQCIPAFVQDMWLEKSGKEWDVVDLKASHCPFISRPAEVAEICMPLFKKWAQ
jgi:hypothetical protein